MENKYEYVISHGKHGITPEDCKTLTWTASPPTEPGKYWAKNKDGSIEILDVDSWSKSAYRPGQNGSVLKSDFTHWLGPLPEPEPPTE
jgi:hypothetical protein